MKHDMAALTREKGRGRGRWLCVAITLLVGPAGLGGVAVAGAPTDSVKETITQVIKILDEPDLKKPGKAEERRRTLEKVIAARFNYDEMAKRALGAEWGKLAEQDQREFVDLFKRLLSSSYADKIEGYTGEEVHYLSERKEDKYAEVRTKIISGKAEIPLDYRMVSNSDDWRVYDVVVDGVSLVNNYRGQFSKILRTSSYADLAEKLRQKIEKPKAP